MIPEGGLQLQHPDLRTSGSIPYSLPVLINIGSFMQTDQAINSGKFSILKPRKALNKAFLKVKPNRSQIQKFKDNLIQLLDRTNDTESEEFHKNLVTDFLHSLGDKHFSISNILDYKGKDKVDINVPGLYSDVTLHLKKPH